MPEFAHLIDGYKRFKTDAYAKQRARYDELADGQSPPVMIISCCDSRVDPATIFDTEPGQVFALRNVANLVPPFETGGGLHGASAAIEFAVVDLAVKHIVVMGHGRCGGVRAALTSGDQGTPGHSFIDDWMAILSDARNKVLASDAADKQRALEFEGVKCSLGNLMSFPFIAERVEAGDLKLHGVWFAIAEGELHVLDRETDRFLPAQ